jgi:hypothetical protein
MRHLTWIWVMAVLAGCASPKVVVTQAVASAPVLPAETERKAVETRYEVRGYRESGSPAIRHEAHAVFRRTLVPANGEATETVPRTAFAPASYAPLPVSEELNAELAKQKAITADMRTMQSQMAETQTRMQTQYSLLVKQSSEALKVRDALEAERNRAHLGTSAADAVATNGDTAAKTQAKW